MAKTDQQRLSGLSDMEVDIRDVVRLLRLAIVVADRGAKEELDPTEMEGFAALLRATWNKAECIEDRFDAAFARSPCGS